LGIKKNLLVVAGLVLCAFASLGLAYWLVVSIGGPEAEQWLLGHWKSFETFLLANGFLLFAAIAVLPALILPVAPLLTLAGIWGGEKGAWLSCAYASLAVIVNLSWTYWLAAGLGRGLIERLLHRTKYKIPAPDKENEFVWALILRLTPGVPFIFTNYALGLIRMPFWRYFIISAPVLSITAGGYVLTFAGIFGGDWQYVWMGASVIAVISLIGKLLVKKGKKTQDKDV
tara:strand:- start:1416 stop:2102 length:687 start_codon:yes stop_codon:yes gene_type:complete